jgi:hypothetical protein
MCYGASEELKTGSPQIYNAKTVQALEQQRRNVRWAADLIRIITGLPHNAIWHGRVNPKRCYVCPAPDTPRVVYLGAHGVHRPRGSEPPRSSQGSSLAGGVAQQIGGRPMVMGLSWGASQQNNQDVSSRRRK